MGARVPWYAFWRERVTPDAIVRADLALFQRVARWDTPLGDRVLPRLTRAANHSRLWMVIAVALDLAGGRFERRAALRGMVSVGLASAIANVPAKLIARRVRPDQTGVPMVRRLARLPSSSSFPSGHSASAFAFATGASIEKPALAPVLLPLAGAVAFSRVYTGVHYPSDVAVGSALGVGVAFATRRWWPVAPEEPAGAPARLTHLADRPGSDGEGLVVVANPGAGPTFGPDTAEALRAELPAVQVVEREPDDDLTHTLEKAAAGATVLGVCGGDGSVNAAAAVARRLGEPLVVVPGGTLNHFARDLGLHDVSDVVEAVRAGHTVAVDVGEIDGRVFMNTASLGSYVDLVDAREALESRIGKWPAVLVALLRVLRRGRPVEVEIDGRRMKVWMVFVGNCAYHPRGLTPSWRERLDDGLLDVRIVDGTEPYGRLRLMWALLTGTLGTSRVYRCFTTTGPVRVRSLDGPLRLARDGETFDASATEFTIGKSDEPLTVFAPRRD